MLRSVFDALGLYSKRLAINWESFAERTKAAISLLGHRLSINDQNPFAPASLQWGGRPRPPWTQSEGGGEAGGDAHPTIKLDLMRRGPLFIDSL